MLLNISGNGKPFKNHSLAGILFDAISDDILNGVYGPGDRLGIDKIAKGYEVSQTPVREALARVAGTGLVEHTGLKGFRVAPLLSQEAVEELIEFRALLEPEALRLAMSSDDLEHALEAALQEHRDATDALPRDVTEGDYQTLKNYFEADWMFHEAILDRAGNRYIQSSLDTLSFSLHRMRQTIHTGHSDAISAVKEHEAILQAVKTGDPILAAATMRNHLANVKDRASYDSQ